MKKLLIVCIFLPIQALAAVWTNTESWTPEWEQKYQEWVKTEWTRDYFTKPGPYQNVALDCADAVYAMRLVFSSLNGLPFAMKDPTGSGIISNDMTRFDKLSKNERLRSFLLYVFAIGSTASLPNDSYPVAVNRKAITSGVFLLTDRKSHHSWTVRYISDVGIPFLIFASRPAKTVFYERYEYPSIGFTFPMGILAERHAGFRAFRTRDQLRMNVWDVPGYSLEQYQIPDKVWISTMTKRLQLRQESVQAKLERVLIEACRGSSERAEIVRQGFLLSEKIGSRCMNSKEYDDFSTPNRDARMKATFEDLASSVEDYEVEAQQNPGAVSLDADLYLNAKSVVSGLNLNTNYCSVQIGGPQTGEDILLPLREVFLASVQDRLSNNPHDSLKMRWGLQKGPSSKAKSCPVY